MRFMYEPKGVCASKMLIEIEDDLIKSVQIIGGCPGNTEAVSRLCVGRKVDEVISILEGIDCRGRGTSCPDQLSHALCEVKKLLLVKN